MSDTQHTPGPWRYKRGEGRYSGSHYIEASVYSTPSVISGRDQIGQCNGYDDEVSANARLIAAAPDLLEALRVFANIGISENEDYRPEIRLPREAIVAARAAVDKATKP